MVLTSALCKILFVLFILMYNYCTILIFLLLSQTIFANLLCSPCKKIFQDVSISPIIEKRESTLEFIADNVCILIKASGQCSDYQCSIPVCKGIMKEEVPIVINAIEQRVNPEQICSYFHLCDSSLPIEPYPTKIVKTVGELSSSMLHISDIHVDYEYVVGGTTDCDRPLCCRDKNNSPQLSGEYGTLIRAKCDIPEKTLESMIDDVLFRFDGNWGIITGDIIPHDVWNQSILYDTDDILRTYRHLRKLPITLFPTIGNHEVYPINEFSGRTDSWLYNLTAELWSPYLSQQAQDSLRYGGYYTESVGNVRIISLNTGLYQSDNLWLKISGVRDLFGQQKWLLSVLQQSSTLGEKVIIIGHVPLQDNLYYQTYKNIICPYQKNIISMFFGHTHYDEFRIMNCSSNYIPIYLAPSLTTYDGHIPSYRIFDYHSADYTQYNMPKLDGIWSKLYQYSEIYPKEMINIVQNFDKYWKYYSSFSASGGLDVLSDYNSTLNSLLI